MSCNNTSHWKPTELNSPVKECIKVQTRLPTQVHGYMCTYFSFDPIPFVDMNYPTAEQIRRTHTNAYSASWSTPCRHLSAIFCNWLIAKKSISLLLLYGWLVGLVIIAWDPCLLACIRLRCWVTLFTAEKQKQNTITWPVGVVVGVGVGVGVVAVAAMACGLDMISLLIFTLALRKNFTKLNVRVFGPLKLVIPQLLEYRDKHHGFPESLQSTVNNDYLEGDKQYKR
uniref:Uncharacterized protein n=1 Tax=Glossina palpalis gambiensis TaxID=67801 RepID=A0A1B0AZV7_9MUSC